MSASHEVTLILTLTGGLTAALLLGFITQKMRLSPLVCWWGRIRRALWPTRPQPPNALKSA